MDEVTKLQAEYVRERDEKEFALGDTLDVKTSVILAVIVFLAAQSQGFFDATPAMTPHMKCLQYISVGALILAGTFAVLELFPRDYGSENTPSSYDKWLKDLRDYYADEHNADDLVLQNFMQGRTQRAAERAEANMATNKLKSRFMFCSFLCTTLSLAANLATLFMRLF